MAIVTNFDELKRLHSAAIVGGVKSVLKFRREH